MRARIRNLVYLLMYVFYYPFNKFKKNKISLSARLNGGIINRSIVGSHTYIGPNTIINGAEIGNYTSIAPGVQIGGMEHSIDWYSTSTVLSDRCVSNQKTYIGNNVWIAANAIIKQGVSIGDGAVVGASAFVNKDVPSNSIVVGIPGKIIKERLNNEMLGKISNKGFWDLNPKEIKKILNND